MIPWVVATRCGEYRSLFDRRSGLLARYFDLDVTPGPETLVVRTTGPERGLLDLVALRKLLDQAPLCRQIHLCGDAAGHPALASILRAVRDRGIVPSVLLAGQKLRTDVREAVQRFCGAVGFDCGMSPEGILGAKALCDSGLPAQAHVPVDDSTVSWVTTLLDSESLLAGLRGVVLIGRTGAAPGSPPTTLTAGPALERLVEAAVRKHSCRVAYDARLSPMFASVARVHPSTLGRCEAGRSALFVDHDLSVAPCPAVSDRVGSLADESLERIWNGAALRGFRERVDAAPCACTLQEQCGGGCPAAPRLCAAPWSGPGYEGKGGVALRIGFSSAFPCDRPVVNLERSQLVRALSAVRAWAAIPFFNDDGSQAQVATSWSSLEYFLSLDPMWGQDLAKLHDQLVAGTFESIEIRP